MHGQNACVKRVGVSAGVSVLWVWAWKRMSLTRRGLLARRHTQQSPSATRCVRCARRCAVQTDGFTVPFRPLFCVLLLWLFRPRAQIHDDGPRLRHGLGGRQRRQDRCAVYLLHPCLCCAVSASCNGPSLQQAAGQAHTGARAQCLAAECLAAVIEEHSSAYLESGCVNDDDRRPMLLNAGRVMLGATNPADSAPGTIRGDLCIHVGRNICHGSDSVESAEHEVGWLLLVLLCCCCCCCRGCGDARPLFALRHSLLWGSHWVSWLLHANVPSASPPLPLPSPVQRLCVTNVNNSLLCYEH